MSQPLEALERANRVRYGRRDVKAELASGILPLRDALADERVATMPVHKLLASMRSWGPTRAMTLLVEVGVSPLRELGSLTDRERDFIAEYAPMTPKEREVASYKRGLEKVLQEAQRRGWKPRLHDAAGVVVVTVLGEAMLTDLEDLGFLQAELEAA